MNNGLYLKRPRNNTNKHLRIVTFKNRRPKGITGQRNKKNGQKNKSSVQIQPRRIQPESLVGKMQRPKRNDCSSAD